MKGKCVIVLAGAALALAPAGWFRHAGKASAQPAPAPGAEQTPQAAPATATAAAVTIDAEHLAKARRLVDRGLAFLLKGQNADGGWGFAPGSSHPALAAMAIKSLLQHGDYNRDSPQVARAVESMMKSRQPDGGFYDPKEGNANYVTSVVVMALAELKDPRRADALAGAVKFLRGQQIALGSKAPDGEEITDKHPYSGGVSYGQHGRPDLSNVGFWMDAMQSAGVPADDPAVQRTLAFVKRLQNRTEGTEGQVFVVRGEDDGGFIYALHKKGEAFEGESGAGSGDRGLRSYGSMTYVGFKSMLYAGLRRDDPRVRAAYDWIRRYWRLDSNPNMPEAQSRQGLYYYYHVYSRALRAWGQDVIEDPRGVKHNWRHELIDVLAAQQKDDGSWANAADRWMESSPVLVTCYAVLALQEALQR